MRRLAFYLSIWLLLVFPVQSQDFDDSYDGSSAGRSGWDLGYGQAAEDEAVLERRRQKELEQKQREEQQRRKKREQSFFVADVSTYDKSLSRTQLEEEANIGKRLDLE